MMARRWRIAGVEGSETGWCCAISGQDATADGCNSIVKGEQTVLGLQRHPPALAVGGGLGRQVPQGQSDPNLKKYTMAELTNDKSKTGDVMAYFLPVVQVTKDNVYDLIVRAGSKSTTMSTETSRLTSARRNPRHGFLCKSSLMF